MFASGAGPGRGSPGNLPQWQNSPETQQRRPNLPAHGWLCHLLAPLGTLGSLLISTAPVEPDSPPPRKGSFLLFTSQRQPCRESALTEVTTSATLKRHRFLPLLLHHIMAPSPPKKSLLSTWRVRL